MSASHAQKASIGDRLKNALLPGHSNSSTSNDSAQQQQSHVTFHPAQEQQQAAPGAASSRSVTGLEIGKPSVAAGATGSTPAHHTQTQSQQSYASNTGTGSAAAATGAHAQHKTHAIHSQAHGSAPASAADVSVRGASAADLSSGSGVHTAARNVDHANQSTFAEKPHTGASVLVGTGASGTTGGATLQHETHTITSSMHGIDAAPQAVVVDTSKVYTDFMPQQAHSGAWLQSLVAKMEAASLEIDRAAKSGQEQISVEAAAEIKRLVAENQLKQRALIEKMKLQAQTYDADYNKKRAAVIAQLDKEQDAILKELQSKLHAEQEALGADTQRRVEQISELARSKKMTILGEAQQQHSSLEKSLLTSSSSIAVSSQSDNMTKHHLLDSTAAAATTGAKEHQVYSDSAERTQRKQI